MDSINSRIDFLIKNLGITKTKFAESIHVSSQFVSAICSGAKLPSDRTIADICREFGVSLAWLETGEGEMYVRRSVNEELALMVADLMGDADESFRKRFVTALLALPPESWGRIEQFVRSLSAGQKSTEGE